ncbi:uncharacterized protein B0H18DRAFT_887524 [Fomitopsis serialis]|uniref:uncharacterized protein n=1 Tax=Fomitopsis serialis TaxID=139415 RepID=UPI002007EC83|nr:uncharacterized protein B0H18DRAFT_887524 [Neoantrodia serialis]KAH9914014.1 hypothetical protein B0H18DRAFT_887524 [Neoantrodia serialis]
MTLLALGAFLFLARFALLQVHGSQTFWPLAIPLAVRTPYLNTWMYKVKTVDILHNQMPSFLDTSYDIGWNCYIRVDGETYIVFGDNNFPPNYTVAVGSIVQTELTPTRTIQVIEAGPMNITLTFLSPISPSDLIRQSLPFAYAAVGFASTDGQPHAIQMYCDLTGQWLADDSREDQEMSWRPPTQTSTIIYHQFELVNQVPFQEQALTGRAIDGAMYFAMGLGRNITWQTCEQNACRGGFVDTGRVNPNDNNSTFRDIDDDWPVFPISVDLGSVASLDSPVVWTVGYVRDPSISYTLSGNTVSLRPYYTTQYPTTEDALEFFVSDFNDSLTQAKLFDTQVREAASSISVDGKLYDMLSLATRQVFSSLEITAPYQSDGTTRIFMKDLGTSQRVTPVEKLYAALPMFLYYNASLVKLLLAPLLEQQNTSLGAYPYASKDLGSLFPDVSGPNLTYAEAIELVIAESGNMLIIALAHAKYSNDTSLLHGYYPLLKDWAEYLTAHGPFPPQGQLSVDDGSDATNSTNLAVKGIFAIQAMAEISQLVGQSNDSQQFSSTASNYMNTWQSLAISSGGASASVKPKFGSEITGIWSLPYNLYPQILFGFNLLNQTVRMHCADFATQWLDKLTVMYGQLLSTSTDMEYTAWNAFIAATCTNDTVRSQLLDAVWNYASFNGTSTPFGAVYNVESGAYQDGMARSVVLLCASEPTSNSRDSPALGGLFAPFLRR